MSNAPLSAEVLVQSAFERMKRNVLRQGHVPNKFYPRGAAFEPDIDHPKQLIERLVIEEDSRFVLKDMQHRDLLEAYTVNVTEDGGAFIRSATTHGALHALETFAQLFFAHSSSTGSYTSYAPISIKDHPDFKHRGLNLDISRNWIPPSDVKRTIEAMAANKLNQLHLHASDSQSWPLEIPALPALAREGAYSPAQIWSVKNLEAVQLYGTYHGIEVYIEIDLPGHTASIGNAYPELVTAKDAKWSNYALEPPSGQLRLNSSDVPPFISTLLNDLLPRTAKHSTLFHLGGDEVNTHAYLLDPTLNTSSPSILQPLLQRFTDHALSLTASHGLTPILWEEMVLDWNLTLPSNTIIQVWRSSPSPSSPYNSTTSSSSSANKTPLARILQKGHRALFGSNSHWYLDCGHGSFLDPSSPTNPNGKIYPPYLDYCSPYKNWRHVYAYDPLDGIASHLHHLVEGGEVHLWGELTDAVNLDGMLWPRVAAAAEVMWGKGSGRLADESTTRRLADMRERLLGKGVRADVVQMEWCLRYEGGCRL